MSAVSSIVLVVASKPTAYIAEHQRFVDALKILLASGLPKNVTVLHPYTTGLNVLIEGNPFFDRMDIEIYMGKYVTSLYRCDYYDEPEQVLRMVTIKHPMPYPRTMDDIQTDLSRVVNVFGVHRFDYIHVQCCKWGIKTDSKDERSCLKEYLLKELEQCTKLNKQQRNRKAKERQRKRKQAKFA